MKKNIFILLFTLISFVSFAQQDCEVFGMVTSSDGTPIPYASIYIPQTSKGSMANVDGEFFFSLPCGKYLVLFQSLGYEAKKMELDLSSTTEYSIVLEPVSYQIEEISVDANQEDIAYNYIRKATAMAEFYKQQIEAYSCKIYVRSFYNPEKIPWIMKKLASDDELKDIQVGNITETLLEYSFTAPNTIKEKILAHKSGIPDSLKAGSNYINLSFYRLGGNSIINPLSINAYQVYNFEHMSSYFDGDLKIHKIKIIPKRKGNDLMSGFIYINDGTWNINKVDVEFDQPLAHIGYQQQYHEVSKLVWMPTNHKIKAKVEVLGFEMEINYLAAISDLVVKTNAAIDHKIQKNLTLSAAEQEILTTKGSLQAAENVSETQQKISTLIAKEKLSKKDGLKLMRLIKKLEREDERQADTTKSFEVNKSRKIEYTDSAFSNENLISSERISLSNKEVEIYKARDSLEQSKTLDSISNDNNHLSDYILSNSKSISFENPHRIFIPYGLVNGLEGGFNTVDGFVFRKALFKYGYDNLTGKFYHLIPTLGYAPARKTVLGNLAFHAQYHQQRRGRFYVEAGRNSNDFDREDEMTEFGNTITSLFFIENYKKFYQADYLLFSHSIDLANGLEFKLSFDYEDRIGLRNYSNQTFTPLEGTYSSNIPINKNVLSNLNLLSDHQSANVDVNLAFTPQQYYRYVKGKKELLTSKYPTFSINYRQGLNTLFNSEADYKFISFAVQQTTKIQLLNAFKYQLEVGKFLSTESLFFADYKNFNSQPSTIIGNYQLNSFKLLNNYRFSTNDYYFEAHLGLEDNNLLLKRLPFMRKNLLTEELNFNYLITEQNIHYAEFGYALNRIFLLMNAGVYASFENGVYQNTNFRIGFNIDSGN